MGKALVIEGLQVSNPLCVITFGENTPERELSAYLAKNKGISITEKNALISMVGTLMDNGIYSKIKSFYPIVGTSVADMIIDAKNVDGDTIFSGGEKRYSYDNGYLKCATNTSSVDAYTIPFALKSKMSFFVGTKYTAFSNTFNAMFFNDNGIVIDVGEYGGSYVPLHVNFAGNNYTATNSYSDKNRVSSFTYDGYNIRLKVNGTSVKNEPLSVESVIITKVINTIVNEKGNVLGTFLCIADALTDAEENIMHTAIDTFLTTIGNRN